MVRSIVCLVISLVAISLSAQDKQLGDYTLKYGYTYFTPSGRSVQNGGAGAIQKLPGEFKFWFSNSIDMFVRSDTIKASKSTGSWVTGAGDTVVGMDLLLIPEAGRKPEIDFTYDVKLPTANGFTAAEVDHEAIVSFIKSINKHSLEADLGDYIEGFSGRPAAHTFELTLSDEIMLNKKWSVVPEFDLSTASPDTPSEIFQAVKFKYQFKDFVLAPGVRFTDTPYTGRFSVFVSLLFKGKLRKKH
jgi:hypothetical protein